MGESVIPKKYREMTIKWYTMLINESRYDSVLY